MKLREEGRLKEKMEFRVETRHVFYLILWSIVLSGAIFYIGLLVGKQSTAGSDAAGLSGEAVASELEHQASSEQRMPTFTFLDKLAKHPEKKQYGDVVLDTMSRFREELIVRGKAEDQKLMEELSAEHFGTVDGKVLQREKEEDPDLGPTAAEPEPDDGDDLDDLPLEGPIMAVQGPDLRSRRLTRSASDRAVVRAKERVLSSHEVAEEKPEKPRPKEKVIPKHTYSIQVKSFQNRDDAMAFLKFLEGELSGSKSKAFLMPVELPDKGKWYRVRVGQFNSKKKALEFKNRFEADQGVQTILVTM